MKGDIQQMIAAGGAGHQQQQLACCWAVQQVLHLAGHALFRSDVRSLLYTYPNSMILGMCER